MVNGQKVWTSGAHDADVLLTFVRTDPDAPKHKGISALVIPTDTPGVTRRPFPDICGQDNLDFNEVFFEDVEVPAENLVGPLNQGWRVANGSLGHERTMMWLGFADRLDNVISDFQPSNALERDHYATAIMDRQALRLLGSVALARAARGEEDVPALSVLKLLGSEAERQACENALSAAGSDGLLHPALTGPYEPMNLDHYFGSWFERYARSFSGHHRRRHLGNPAQHHRPASAWTAHPLRVATSEPDETERPAGGAARRATTAGVERGIHRTGQRHRVPCIGVVRGQEVDRAAHTVGHVDDHRVAAVRQMCNGVPRRRLAIGPGLGLSWMQSAGVTWLARPDVP